MLDAILAMAGIKPEDFEKIKNDVVETSKRLQESELIIKQIQMQVSEMHCAFFQMVPRPPAESQPIQDAELINDQTVEHVGDVIELNTPETAFTVN